jgi:aryl-alcohol dehydrogenase-like predicted oxidoreductase
MQRITIAPGYEISRVIRGGWQLAGGHGTIDADSAVEDMIAFADAGITTFDCADIYTGVEELIGRFRLAYKNLRGAEALARIRVHTKFVPDLTVLPVISKAYVESVIDTSRQRLNLDCLDLVQFHWWGYDIPGWLETAGWLKELHQAGKIEKISGTNFDSDHIEAIIASGVPFTSLQLQ